MSEIVLVRGIKCPGKYVARQNIVATGTPSTVKAETELDIIHAYDGNGITYVTATDRAGIAYTIEFSPLDRVEDFLKEMGA